MIGNAAIQCRNEILEKSVAKVIKIKDSDDHCEEHVQYKHGEKLDSIEIEKRDVFSSSTPSMMKHVEGTKHHVSMIKKIDKSNTIAVYPVWSG